jgi:hypothetical protein
VHTGVLSFPIVADHVTRTIRENYDRLAKEYALRLFGELHQKPLDRELLTRFAQRTKGRRLVCDLGLWPWPCDALSQRSSGAGLWR